MYMLKKPTNLIIMRTKIFFLFLVQNARPEEILDRYKISRTTTRARICKPFKEPRNRFPAWPTGHCPIQVIVALKKKNNILLFNF
jgi:hypothetical protein